MQTIYAAEIVYSEETTDGWRIRSELESFADYRAAVEYVNSRADYYRKSEGYRYKLGQVYEIKQVIE